MPKVSIIVPVYGVEQYIERCARSLFEQTYMNIEYVFVNDVTPDKSIIILNQVTEDYPQRSKDVKIVTHSTNQGVSAARNTGLAAATGDYLLYVDSDDYLSKDAVEQLVNKAEEKNADIILFDTNVRTADGIKYEKVNYTTKEDYICKMLLHTEKCAHWNKFYRGDFYRDSGILADERIRLGDDYAVTPRLVYKARKITVLHKPLYYYETTNQSSYVHNLNRAAIESQRRADQVLVDFFSHVTDKQNYKDVIEILTIRSMVSLIKASDSDTWQTVLDVYAADLTQPADNLTLVNKVIFCLAKHKNYRLLHIFMNFYHWVMKDR